MAATRVTGNELILTASDWFPPSSCTFLPPASKAEKNPTCPLVAVPGDGVRTTTAPTGMSCDPSGTACEPQTFQFTASAAPAGTGLPIVFMQKAAKAPHHAGIFSPTFCGTAAK